MREADGQLLPNRWAPGKTGHFTFRISYQGTNRAQEQAVMALEVTVSSHHETLPFLLAPPKTLTRPLVGQKGGDGDEEGMCVHLVTWAIPSPFTAWLI